ncbi:MMPL family transporter [Allobranchiibius sp. CTAmp26]|uniref:MMPL family transporter n=1 Tax=Allobranchiibius sp. CTAmp26 TaxID=2815214 RepID=UPI001AA1AAE9|nr:MMPL family transporter [Allobranchiibius sp. CTAmp26]
MVRRPWWVIAGWVLLAVIVVATAPKLKSTSDEASFLPNHYESIQAMNLQKSAFPQAATPAAIIVVERADGKALTGADSAKVTAIGATLTAARVPHVTGIQVGPPSPNKLVQTIAVQMPTPTGANDKTQPDAVKVLRVDLQHQLTGTDLKGGITGTAAQTLDSQKSGDRAQAIIGVATIGLIIVLLVVIFRSPIIALLPIVTIGVVSQIADGFIGWANKAFNLKTDSSVTALLIVVLFGVGTDYILFLMFRYRERLRAGEDSKTAMISAVARVGEAIASAAGAVIIAFLALALSTLGLFKSLGPALAIAVAVTLIAGLTLIPAIVSLLGTRVFWPSKSWRREPTGARFAVIGAALGRHPARFAIASGGIMVLLAVAALGFHPNFDLTGGSTSTSSESTVYSKELLKGLPAGATEPTQVYLRSTTHSPLPASEVADYRSTLNTVRGVGQVAAATLSPDRTVAYYQVTLTEKPESAAAIATVRGTLRSTAHHDAPTRTTALVGGITAVYADIGKAVNHDYTVVFPVAAILILLILGLLLRSVVAPWYLMASVGLGFAATLGTTVLLFQHAAGQPGLIFLLPIIMYLFVVALGTDYNILMIARLREEAREGRTPHDAAAMAVRHTGPTVAAAGVILAGTFASLTLAGSSTLVQMGFAISFGIAVAAFVMALFFTPALTALIGHRAWWPGHADTGPATPTEPQTVPATAAGP